jgi:hypothetical protein
VKSTASSESENERAGRHLSPANKKVNPKSSFSVFLSADRLLDASHLPPRPQVLLRASLSSSEFLCIVRSGKDCVCVCVLECSSNFSWLLALALVKLATSVVSVRSLDLDAANFDQRS